MFSFLFLFCCSAIVVPFFYSGSHITTSEVIRAFRTLNVSSRLQRLLIIKLFCLLCSAVASEITTQRMHRKEAERRQKHRYHQPMTCWPRTQPRAVPSFSSSLLSSSKILFSPRAQLFWTKGKAFFLSDMLSRIPAHKRTSYWSLSSLPDIARHF